MEREPQKTELRHRYLNRRRGIPAEDHIRMSETLSRQLASWLQARAYKRVFTFAPFRGEPDISSLHQRLAGAEFFLPVIQSEIDDTKAEQRHMHFHAWQRGESLQENRYGINEPRVHAQSEASLPDTNTAILVPAVLIDHQGYRLGYGGGYYDRFLIEAHACGAISIGVVFEEFHLELLPREDHDIKLNYVATERGVRAI